MAYKTPPPKKTRGISTDREKKRTAALWEKEVLIGHLPSPKQKDQGGEIHLEKPGGCQCNLKKSQQHLPNHHHLGGALQRLTSSLLLSLADPGCVMEKSGNQTAHPCSGQSKLKYRKGQWQALSL